MNDLRNKVQLIGHLGHDVEFRQFEDGNALARVNLATREIRKSRTGGKKVEVQWHQLIAWGRLAENMRVFFKKGKQVAIQGKLAHRSYEDEEGIRRNVSEVVVKEFMLIS